jgi:short-subunit dehydrogenase
MAGRLDGKVAVVTGAASGIGAALAAERARRGCRLVLVDRDAARLAMVAASLPGEGHRTDALDVTDRAAVAALPAAVLAGQGRVDVLVNNAGIAAMGRFDQTSLEAFEAVMAVNFGGTLTMTKAFLPHLGRDGRIANLSSLFGLLAPPGQVSYAASKFAVRGFSEALRHELADTGIKLTCVHPGGVRTAIAANALIADGIEQDRAHAAQTAFGRFLRLDPATAARRIADAVAGGKPRLLIGSDAHFADLLVRLLPARYGGVMRATMGGMKEHVGTMPVAPSLPATAA